MNLGISALAFLLLAGCDDDDTLGTGASGWIFGLLLGLVLLGVALAAWRKSRKK